MMVLQVIIDASVWVSQLKPQDVNSDASRSWVEQFTVMGGILVATDFLSLEVAAAISRSTGDFLLAKEAVRKLYDFVALKLLPLDEALIKSAIDVATDLQLRAGDAIYVALAHQLNIPLVSWDKEQLQKASTLITTYTPENYIFPDTEAGDSGDEEPS